ncbi:hypothetical protein FXO38_26550 [Capsicum annuum]|nr:hypothetical protein FXO38_26550 [Capsicum annuum]
MEKVWGENNDEDAEKFAILYFLHSFVFSSVETVVIPHLYFDLVDSERYKDFPRGSLSFENLARSLNNRLKVGCQFYLIQGTPLAIQDPPPRKINENTKKKQKVDSSTSVAKKPLRKKQVQSKLDIHIEKVVVSKPESHVEKEAFIFKKDFDAFRDEGCTNLHSEKMNVEIDSQQLISDELLRSINLDYLHSEKVVQHDCRTSDEKIDETILSDSQFTTPDEMLPSLNVYRRQSIIIHPSTNRQEESHHEILVAKTSETVIEDHAQTTRGITDLSSKSLMNSEIELATEEQVRTPPNTQEVTNDEQRDEQLNEKVEHYKREKSENPKMHFGVETVENKNWFYTIGFADQTWTDSHIDVCLYYLRKKSKYGPHSSYKNEPNKSYKYSTVNYNFMNVIRSFMDVYSMDHQNLNARVQEHHLIEYINGFHMHAVVPWHTVEEIFILINIKEKYHWVLAVLSFSERCIFLYDSYESRGHYTVVLAEIEKIAKIIPLCLQACDFYVKKGTDLQNHPRYKDKEPSDMFDVLFEDDLPQQPSGNLNCGVFMVTYAECLSYDHKVIATEFDPNTLRTRYAALL